MKSENEKERWNVESRAKDRRRNIPIRNPFGQLVEGKPGNLIEAYQSLKHTYRNYDTRLALRRMQAMRRSVQELNKRGFPIALELLGSINFGLVDQSSDVDCVILHYCNDHLLDGECGLDCPNLQFKKSEFIRVLKEMSGSNAFNIELLDCINFRYIEQQLDRGVHKTDMHILRFLFYRFLGRPVNRPLVIKYFEQLENQSSLMNEFMHWATDALAEYIKTSDHRHSFKKYNERIISSQLRLPKELIEELQNYLD